MDIGWHLRHRRTSGTDHPHPANPGTHIGEPILFSSGQFMGRRIRFELHELQKAESGRKYAKVDRRPLDPPPAVLLRMFEVCNTESHFHRQIQNIGFMCTVDLFPVPDFVYQQRLRASSSPPESSPEEHQGSRDNQPAYPYTYFPLHPYTSPNSSRSQIPFQLPRRQLMLGHLKESEIPSDVVYRVGNHLITESSKMTPAVVGEKVVEPALVDYRGRKALIFVFGDIAVRREGVFILRYRVFDIYSGTTGGEQSPIFAELYGGSFKVYSTRDFPGLEPSTDLTKSLSTYGVRVTLRDAERKSKKRNRSKDS